MQGFLTKQFNLKKNYCKLELTALHKVESDSYFAGCKLGMSHGVVVHLQTYNASKLHEIIAPCKRAFTCNFCWISPVSLADPSTCLHKNQSLCRKRWRFDIFQLTDHRQQGLWKIWTMLPSGENSAHIQPTHKFLDVPWTVLSCAMSRRLLLS